MASFTFAADSFRSTVQIDPAILFCSLIGGTGMSSVFKLDKLIAAILIGNNSDGEIKEYVCDSEFGQLANV